MSYSSYSSPILAGLDEVGRGALAGPLVACGVIIHCPPKQLLKTLPFPPRDSKLLSTKQRQLIYSHISLIPHISHILSVIPVPDINLHGIAWANRQIFLNIIQKLNADHYIIDGNLKFSQLETQNLPVLRSPSEGGKLETKIHADSTILQVCLASIIAKVHRDNLMKQLHLQHPHFNWLHNVGYGTRQHISALSIHGPSPHHRTLFTTTALRNYHPKLKTFHLGGGIRLTPR